MPPRKSRKRNTISTLDAVERIDKMLPLIVENVSIAMQLEAVLETGNSAVRKIRGARWYGADSYNCVSRSLALNLALTLARLFDPGARRIHPNRREIASIPLLIRLLKQKRCQSALGKRARDWTPTVPHLVSLQESTAIESSRAAVAAYKSLRSTHKGRSAEATLKSFRDKRLAHSLADSVLESLPKYEQLFLLLRVACDVARHARLGVLGQNWDPDDFRQEFRREGDAFWVPTIGAIEAKCENDMVGGISPTPRRKLG